MWKIENDKLTVTPIANSYTYTKTPKATMPADTDWSDANIIVGTLGNSKAIDSLAEKCRNTWCISSFCASKMAQRCAADGG